MCRACKWTNMETILHYKEFSVQSYNKTIIATSIMTKNEHEQH